MIIYGLYFDGTFKKQIVRVEDNLTMLKKLDAGEPPSDAFDCRGEKKAVNWDPPAIRWFVYPARNLNRYKTPDISFIDISSSLFFSPHATELMRPVVDDVAELLPIPFNDETWYFLNVFNRIDAFDEAHSSYEIYDSGKRGWLKKTAFFPDKVPHAKLFMIPENRAGIYYAEHHSDDNPNTFKNVLEKNNLSGIHLKVSQEY
jgi:hypothetical protein